MIVHGLPSGTEIRKPVHKKLFYVKFPTELSGERRKQFDDDIGRIIVTNEISPVWETQAKKKFEMFQRLKEYQKRLEGM